MAGLGRAVAGIVIELVGAGFRHMEESEIMECKKVLRKSKADYQILKSSYDTMKDEFIDSSARIADLEDTIKELHAKIKDQQNNMKELYARIKVLQRQEIPSLEEYDKAHAEAEDAFSVEGM